MPLRNFVDIPEAEPGMNVFVDIIIRRISFEQVRIPPLQEGEVFGGVRTIGSNRGNTQKFVKGNRVQADYSHNRCNRYTKENISEELLRIEDIIGENVTAVVVSELEATTRNGQAAYRESIECYCRDSR